MAQVGLMNSNNVTGRGSGGSGGGGAGGYSHWSYYYVNPGAGSANTGSGGGGGIRAGSCCGYRKGAAGGSGVVIIRYLFQ